MRYREPPTPSFYAFVVFVLIGSGVAAFGTWLIPSDAEAQTSTVPTNETLVLTTATTLPAMAGRRGIEVQNLGPNPIYCALGSATPVAGKARMIAANGGTWSLTAASGTPIRCITTVAQVTTAATITTEL